MKKSPPITNFAKSFRIYGISLGLIFAAIPIAINRFELLPFYSNGHDAITFCTTLLSYLLIAFLFGYRRFIGKKVFPSPEQRVITEEMYKQRSYFAARIPSFFIGTAIISLLCYFAVITLSVEQVALNFAYQDDVRLYDVLKTKDYADAELKFGGSSTGFSVRGTAQTNDDKNRIRNVDFPDERAIEAILTSVPSMDIPYRGIIWLSYMITFLSAVATFIWLGLIEYVQQELDLRDKDLMTNPYKKARKKPLKVPEIKDCSEPPCEVLFEVEQYRKSGRNINLEEPVGPLCEKHNNNILKYMGRQTEPPYHHIWSCAIWNPKTKESEEFHQVLLEQSPYDLDSLLAEQLRKMGEKGSIDGEAI